MVYPPPPSTSVGKPKLLTYLTQSLHVRREHSEADTGFREAGGTHNLQDTITEGSQRCTGGICITISQIQYHTDKENGVYTDIDA